MSFEIKIPVMGAWRRRRDIFTSHESFNLTLDGLGGADLPPLGFLSAVTFFEATFLLKTNLENYYLYVQHTMANHQKIGFNHISNFCRTQGGPA